jgi:CheY-like chemotaxis protein
MVTILIVDDDRDILEIQRVLLVDQGFRILEAETLAEAIEIIESDHPDVVLLDLVFPEDPEFGVHAATEIRKLHPTLPIFLVTSINRDYLTGITRDAPVFDEIVIKPVDVATLTGLLHQYSDRREDR